MKDVTLQSNLRYLIESKFGIDDAVVNNELVKLFGVNMKQFVCIALNDDSGLVQFNVILDIANKFDVDLETLVYGNVRENKKAVYEQVKVIVDPILKSSYTQSLSVSDILGKLYKGILGVQDYIMENAGKGQLDGSKLTINQWYCVERYLNMVLGLVKPTECSEEYQESLEWFLKEVIG